MDVKELSPNVYEVTSEKDPAKTYQVWLSEMTCTCPHYMHRMVECKHLRAAKRFHREGGLWVDGDRGVYTRIGGVIKILIVPCVGALTFYDVKGGDIEILGTHYDTLADAKKASLKRARGIIEAAHEDLSLLETELWGDARENKQNENKKPTL